MAPGEKLAWLCPECGAANRVGETTCFLCGGRSGTDSPAQAGAKSFNPYAPPSVSYAPPAVSVPLRPSFHISSMLLIIAVIAVCLGVWQAQPLLGVIVAVIVVPALGYTSVIAFQSASKGRPLAVSEKLNRFLAALMGVVVILFAALVAFCMTCVPTGFIALECRRRVGPDRGARGRWTLCRGGGCGDDVSASETEKPGCRNNGQAMNQPRTGSILGFRISSLLLIIAVIAVCLAAGQVHLWVGISASLLVLPALAYTCVRAYKNTAEGRPMEVLDKVRTFVDRACAARF